MDRFACRTQIGRGFAVGMVAYAVLLVGAVTVLNAVEHPQWVGVLLAVPPAAAAIYAVTSQFRALRRLEGVERTQVTDAAAWSFYVVALSAMAYFLMEALADAPRIPMVLVWVYAMAVFGVANTVAWRRYQ
jgi:hypothetical protein